MYGLDKMKELLERLQFLCEQLHTCCDNEELQQTLKEEIINTNNKILELFSMRYNK